MSFPVAVQSAVFYILACTPCAKVRHRHRSREVAKKGRAEKARIVAEQPGLYRHPSPFNTNPFWHEEITMGPSLPKKTSSKNSSQRHLESAGRDSAAASTDAAATAAAAAAAAASLESKTSVTQSIPEDDVLDDAWNRTRYQREDEELWGQWPGYRLVDAIVKASSSAGRYVEAKLGIDKPSPAAGGGAAGPASTLAPAPSSGSASASAVSVTTEERSSFYISHRNPPLNEYHPPVISSRPAHPDAHRWMIQPPPPAKVMEGKIPARRATGLFSNSSISMLAGSGVELDKQQQQQQAPREALSEEELIESLLGRAAPARTLTGRSRSFSVESSSSYDNSAADRNLRARSRVLVRSAHAESDEEEGGGDDTSAGAAIDDDAADDADDEGGGRTAGRPLHAAQRPKLQTIMSSRIGSTALAISNQAEPAPTPPAAPVAAAPCS